MEYVGTALAEMTMPQISPLAGEPIERADAERLGDDAPGARASRRGRVAAVAFCGAAERAHALMVYVFRVSN